MLNTPIDRFRLYDLHKSLTKNVTDSKSIDASFKSFVEMCRLIAPEMTFSVLLPIWLLVCGIFFDQSHFCDPCLFFSPFPEFDVKIFADPFRIVHRRCRL